jgi:hypothetical protein
MATTDPFSSPLAKSSSTPSYADQAKAIGDAAQATAVTGSFDESKGAAGRVQQITDYGGPLMAAARTRSRQASVRSGLQNTSTAAQAGEQAVIETATPLATTDAQLYQNQQLANQNAQNSVNIANANIRAQTGIAGLNLGENARQFDSGLAWDKDKTGMNLVEQRRQFDSTVGLEREKLGISQSQFNAQLSQQDQQFAQNLQLQKDNLAAQREQFAQKLGLDTAQLQLNRDQLSQQDRQFLAELDQRNAQLAQQESQFTRDQQNKVTLANLDAANRERLVQIEAGYKTQIAGNENISRAWGTMMDSINQIQNNPDLDQSAKQTLISNTQAAFQSFANFWKKVSGGTADVSDLLNFGPVGSGQGSGSAGGSYGGRGGYGGGGGGSDDYGVKPGDRGG